MKKWACSACTLLNEQELNFCNCGTPRQNKNFTPLLNGFHINMHTENSNTCNSNTISSHKKKLILHNATVINKKSNSIYNRKLKYAVENGDEKLVNELMDLGADFSILDNDQNNLLHISCKNGHLEMCKFLINNYPNLKTDVNKDNLSPIEIAIKAKKYNILGYLITEFPFGQYIAEKSILRKKVYNLTFNAPNNKCNQSYKELEKNDDEKVFSLEALNKKLLEGPYILNELSPVVQKNEKLIKSLFDYIKISKTKKNISIAAANAMTILNTAGVSFSGKNLSRINVSTFINNRWKGPNISGEVFYKTDFTGADLRGAIMFNCCFQKARFNNAKLHEVKFFRYLKTFSGRRYYGHGQYSAREVISPNGKYFVHSDEASIKLREIGSGKLIKTFNKSGYLKRLAILANVKYNRKSSESSFYSEALKK